MPLHGRLSVAEQSRAFRPAPAGRTKVVVATDVAEASVTIPDCTNVIDCGLARSVVGEALVGARGAARRHGPGVGGRGEAARGPRGPRARGHVLAALVRRGAGRVRGRAAAGDGHAAALRRGAAGEEPLRRGRRAAPRGLPDAAAVGPGGGGGRELVEICVEIISRR